MVSKVSKTLQAMSINPLCPSLNCNKTCARDHSNKKIGKNKMLIKTMNALYRVQYRVADYTQFRYVMITAGLTGGTDSG